MAGATRAGAGVGGEGWACAHRLLHLCHGAAALLLPATQAAADGNVIISRRFCFRRVTHTHTASLFGLAY
eukprot:3477342-Prymnesium_polylepis.1